MKSACVPVCGRLSKWRAIALAGFVALGACATPAHMDPMIPDQFEASEAHPDSPFREGIVIEKVGGGEAPDPMMDYSAVGTKELEGALSQALSRFGYLSADGERAPYRMQVFLVDMRRPGVGLTMVATSIIRYKLTRAHDGRVVYDDIVTASATKNLSDALGGAVRHRLVVEAAVRANIIEFLAALRSPELERSAR